MNHATLHGLRPGTRGLLLGDPNCRRIRSVDSGPRPPAANGGRITDDLFTAGGALGLAIDRDHDLLRAEVEGRGREAMAGETPSVVIPFAYDATVADGWSVTANLWRALVSTITGASMWAVDWAAAGIGSRSTTTCRRATLPVSRQPAGKLRVEYLARAFCTGDWQPCGIEQPDLDEDARLIPVDVFV